MSSPLLSNNLVSDVAISGDVTIHPEAIIASGVILRAAADSRIVIEADVCLGKGTVIHACGGEIEIDRGAMLGSKVLIFGAGRIGSHVCIGAETTIIDPKLVDRSTIAAGSLLGDNSRQSGTVVVETDKGDEDFWDTETIEPTAEVQAQLLEELASELEEVEAVVTVEGNLETIPEANPEGEPTEVTIEAPQATNNIIVGKLYVDRLLLKLFPHRQADINGLNGNSTPPQE